MVDVVVTYDYVATEEDELTIKIGDVISDVVKHDGGWWEGTINGKKGMFPDNFVKDMPKKEKAKENAPVKKQTSTGGGGAGGHVAQLTAKLGSIKLGGPGGPPVTGKRESKKKPVLCRAKATYSYTPENDDEVEINVGDIIEVTKQDEEGWWEGRTESGKEGLFPSNFVQAINEDEEKPVEEETPDFHEIKGKKTKGIGFGNIFGDGPIKLRKTHDETPENNKPDPPMLKTKKVAPQAPTEDVPALPPKHQEPKETKQLFDYSLAETGNVTPSSATKRQYFYVMNGGDCFMTQDEDVRDFAGRPSIDSQNLMFMSFENESSPADDSMRTCTGMSVRTSAEFHTPMGAGASGDDSMCTLGSRTPTSAGDEQGEEVPLNLSALSQTRETPPLRRTFIRRKRKKGAREATSPQLFTPSPEVESPASLTKSPVYTICEEPEGYEYVDSEEDTTTYAYDDGDMLDESELSMLQRMGSDSLKLAIIKSPSDPCLYQERYTKKRVSFSQSQEGAAIENVSLELSACPHSILKNTPPRDAKLARLLSYNTPNKASAFQADITDSIKLLRQRRSISNSPANNSSILEDKGVQCCFEELQMLSDEETATDESMLNSDKDRLNGRRLNRHGSLRQSFSKKLRAVFSLSPSRSQKTRSLPRNIPAPVFDDYELDFELPDFLNDRNTLPRNVKFEETKEDGGGDQRRSVVGDVVKELMDVKDRSMAEEKNEVSDTPQDRPSEKKRRSAWFLFRKNVRQISPEPKETDDIAEAGLEGELEKMPFEDTPKTISYLEHLIQSGRVGPTIQRLAMKYECFLNTAEAGDNINNIAADITIPEYGGDGSLLNNANNNATDVNDPDSDVTRDENMSKGNVCEGCSEKSGRTLFDDAFATGDCDKVLADTDKVEYINQSSSSDTSYTKAIQAMMDSGEFLGDPVITEDMGDYEKRMHNIHLRYVAEIANGGLMPTIEIEQSFMDETRESEMSDDIRENNDATQSDVDQVEESAAAESPVGGPPASVLSPQRYDEIWSEMNESLEAQHVIDAEMSFLSDHEEELIAAEAEFAKVAEKIEAYPVLDLETYHDRKMKECEQQWQKLAKRATPSKLRRITDRMVAILKSPFQKLHPFGTHRIPQPDNSLSIIDERTEENSLTTHDSRNVSQAELTKPAETRIKAKIDQTPINKTESPDKDLDLIAKHVVADVFARVSLQQSIKNLNNREVVLLDEKNLETGEVPFPRYDMPDLPDYPSSARGSATTSPAPVRSPASQPQSDSPISTSQLQPDSPVVISEFQPDNTDSTHQNKSDSPVSATDVEIFMSVPGQDDILYASDVSNLTGTSFHETQRKECRKSWHQVSESKVTLPGPAVMSRSASSLENPVPGEENMAHKSATLPRKRRFIDRWRKKSYPYPPASEWQGDEMIGEEVLSGPRRKEASGILKRLSLRRAAKPVSSTPVKSEKPQRKASILKRLSLKRSERPPRFIGHEETTEERPDAVGEKVEKKRGPLARLLRKLMARKRRHSGSVPEEITAAIASSTVDQSLESSGTATSLGTGTLPGEKSASVIAMQGSCSSSSNTPIAMEKYIIKPDDTSITFSASSLPLPENTKSPATRQIYQVVKSEQEMGYLSESPPPCSMAIDSFTFGSGDSSLVSPFISQHHQDMEEYFSSNFNPGDLRIPTPENTDRNRLSLYEELGAAGGADSSLNQLLQEDLLQQNEKLDTDIQEIIASLINPDLLTKPEVLDKSWINQGEGEVRVDDAVMENISLENINVEIPPRSESPGLCGYITLDQLAEQKEAGHGDSSSVSSLTSDELKDLILNTSENAKGYYKITSGSLSSSVTQSDSGSTPVTPASPSDERARVLYSYSAENEDELSLDEGDILNILEKELEDSGWWKGEYNGKVGVFPDNFVELLPPETAKPRKPPPPVVPPNSTKHKIERPPPPEPSKPESPRFNKKDTKEEKKAPTPGKKPAAPPPLHPKGKAKTERNLIAQTDDHKAKEKDNKTENTLDSVEPSKKLSHPTANRAKAPQRRPPSLRNNKEEHPVERTLPTIETIEEKEVAESPAEEPPAAPERRKPQLGARPLPSLERRGKEEGEEKKAPGVRRPPPPVHKEEVPSPRSPTRESPPAATPSDEIKTAVDGVSSEEIVALKEEIGHLKATTVSREAYDGLKDEVAGLREEFNTMRTQFKHRINELIEEVDEEKKHRLNTQVQIDRVKKLVMES